MVYKKIVGWKEKMERDLLESERQAGDGQRRV